MEGQPAAWVMLEGTTCDIDMKDWEYRMYVKGLIIESRHDVRNRRKEDAY